MKTSKVAMTGNAQLPILNALPRVKIKINKRSVRKAIEFMKQLSNSAIPSKNIFFDKTDGGLRRKIDLDMDLEKFIELLEKNKSKVNTLGLQIGDPDPYRIVFVACFKDEQGSTRFAWFNCIYNSRNLEIVNEIFKDIFGKCLT